MDAEEWGGGGGGLVRPTFMSVSLSSTVSHSYGYGLLDAGAIVELAKTWTSVGPQRKCVITVVSEPRLVHTHTLHTRFIRAHTGFIEFPSRIRISCLHPVLLFRLI